jgi:ribosomal protein S18 acetylase RimI-like enzyme
VPLPGLTLRAPEPGDAEAVARLSNAETLRAVGLADTSVEELLATWSEPHEVEGPRDAVIVAADGTVVASITVRVDLVEHEVFGYAVMPLEPPPGLGEALLEEIERRAAWWHERAGVAGVLRLGGLDAPGPWATVLEASGYEIVRRFLLMRVPLAEPVDAPRWPDGIELRPFDRDLHARAVHAALAEAFADHFGPPFDPFDTWYHLVFVKPMLAYRDDLLLIAWDGDEVAGVLTAAERVEEAPDGGYVAELGVRRAYRGRGLGRALLLEAFARLRALGRAEAVLHVDQDSETNATGLYRGVGMREQRMYASWQRRAGG